MHRVTRQPRFIYAALLFALLNLAILLVCGRRTLAMQLPGPMSTWTLQYEKQKSSPDVVLLGSSVMRTPLLACDKANFSISENLEYCQSQELTKRISSSTKNFKVFNAARDGLMVTDALLIEDQLLHEPLRPKVLVYGVSPRDFNDSLLWSERSTEPFQYYFNFSKAVRYSESFSTGWQDRLGLILGETIPLYSSRKTLVTTIENQFEKSRPITKTLPRSNVLSDQNLNAKRIQTLMSEAARDNEAAFLSTAVQVNAEELLAKRRDETKIWKASIWQYTMRYFSLDRKRFGRQSRAFKNLLKLAKERGIKILVINMPLSPDNLALLPIGFHQAYLTAIRESCAEQSADFLDLQTDRSFTRACFEDVAHLNANGGHVFIERLAPVLLQALQTSSRTNINSPLKTK